MAATEANGIRHAVATEAHKAAVVRLVSESFCHDPMGAALGLSERDFVPFVERYAAEVTTNGLFLVAAPAADPGTLAGVFINHDFKSAHRQGFPMTSPGSRLS